MVSGFYFSGAVFLAKLSVFLNSNPLNRFSLPIRAGQCSARIFALPARTGRAGGMKQPPGKSALCPKPAHRIWWTDANFLLATETIMCYNILVKTSTATATPEKPGSTTCRADITIPASVVSSMQIPQLSLEQTIPLVAIICSHTA